MQLQATCVAEHAKEMFHWLDVLEVAVVETFSTPEMQMRPKPHMHCIYKRLLALFFFHPLSCVQYKDIKAPSRQFVA